VNAFRVSPEKAGKGAYSNASWIPCAAVICGGSSFQRLASVFIEKDAKATRLNTVKGLCGALYERDAVR